MAHDNEILEAKAIPSARFGSFLSRFIAIFLITLFMGFRPAPADTVSVNLVAFSTIRDNAPLGSGSPNVIWNFTSISTTYVNFTGNLFEDRGILEFPLSSISGTVTSAVLKLNVTAVGGGFPRPFDVFAYQGNGSIELNDFSSGVFSTSATAIGFGLISVPIDTAVFKSILASSSFIGFNFRLPPVPPGDATAITVAAAAILEVEVAVDPDFDNSFNFREFRVNPPPNFTQGPDLLVLGLDVIDTGTGVAPIGALVGAENLATGEKFFLRPFGTVGFELTIPYTPDRASGTWVIGVTSDTQSASTLIPSFGTGLGTGAIPGVDNLAIVPGAQPMFSWNLPAGLPGFNDGNIDRIRVRIQDSNGDQILDDRFSPPPTETSYTTPPAVITHNGAYVGQVLVEGFIPFDRSRTYETFVVETVGTGGVGVTGIPFFFRDNLRANSVRFGEGDRLVVGIDDVFPFGDTFVHAENGDTIVPLSQAREADRQFEFAASFAYDSGLTTPWTIVAWNGGVESIAVSHAVGAVALMPFVDNIRMLPDFLEPTLEWDLPASGVFDNIQIGLFDDVTDDRLSVFGLSQDQLFETLPVTATSYTFEPGVLEAGKKYVVRILLRDQDGSGNGINRSLTFFNFSPILMTSATPVFLPSLDPGGVYNFDFDVTAGFSVTIDPHLAVGYEYAIGAGDPRFATVTLPFVGDGDYDLVLFDDTDNPLPSIPLVADVPFDFTTEVGPSGVDKFLILGIEESASLDPNDSTAFMTELTFVANGEFTGSMTPITEPDDTTINNLVASLKANVQTLIESLKLTTTLDRVLVLVGNDNIVDACNQLNKFIKDVGKLIRIGELDADDGDPLPLIEQAEAFKSIAGCQSI